MVKVSPREEENEKIYHNLLESFLASRCSMGARRIAPERTNRKFVSDTT
ncbi:hypothetical protein NIA71_13395 [Ihubacter massiliensis]|uniref:Uncharacterized protein n=1 Tax=Hominibacterium faecale TaxID=2839743 RepID=A0A9J6QI73_9FIRM|nr:MULTISPECIES: hypothetical protein [Eubacteriales Family XIII. Incertae Sedis]MCO7122939.1 hypothetical protein [Ihubacter massiliensis]MCU7377200.1 hypothetical protein [Hominibacterium faecale]MDE8731570.1 hypothetical protein [Eubacteriales bacterium DFI.9.88]